MNWVNSKICFLLILMSLFALQCVNKPDNKMLNEIEKAMKVGDFSKVKSLSDSIKQISVKHDENWMLADSFEQVSARIVLDFRHSEEDVNKQLENSIGEFTKEDKQRWEDNKLLEYKIIDGEKRYFRNAVPNLLRKIKPDTNISALGEFRLKNTGKILQQNSGKGDLTEPVRFKIVYKISLDANAVPDGKLVRCWMPLPKTNNVRHSDLQIISTSEPQYEIAADSAMHYSLYMEKIAKADKKTIFEIQYSYSSFAQYYNLDELKIEDYDTSTELYRNNTKQELPHIVFSEKIKHLADSIVGNETNPVEIVRSLYKWIDKNIPWASALEYSTIDCIPEYAIENMKGDCGIKTLLFMSMARYKGIPVKWQSGWMLHPGHVNLHDWCEVFYQPIGWVPMDMSYGLQYSDNKKISEFYISGIDSYRMIVNDAIGKEFYPKKKFLRSEPWDFQRGELEWEEGNIYFNLWDYKIEVSVL